jgi:phage gpG-like protein
MLELKLNLTERSRQLLHDMPDLVIPALKKGMDEAVILAEGEARLNTSGRILQRRTGRLRGSITHSVRISGNKVIGTIGSNVVYARIHELGGVIRPVRAKALHFVIPGVGHRTAQSVTIPARPYLRPAFAENIEEIGRVLVKHIEAAFEEV